MIYAYRVFCVCVNSRVLVSMGKFIFIFECNNILAEYTQQDVGRERISLLFFV